MIICDTSAAAKLYVSENESRAVRALLENEDQVFASALTRVELMSVFHRMLREKLWTGPQFQTAVHQFTTDENGGFWNWLPLENAIIESAAKTYTTLSNIVYLRASDCLHLITALHHNFAEIYTYDPHQTRAAVALGLSPVAVQP